MTSRNNQYANLADTRENLNRIAFVEQAFGSSGIPLKLKGRVLVGEGVLTKICRKKPKPRQFFLFNDIIVYGNILINRKSFNQQHIIELDSVSVEEVEDSGQLRNGFCIKSPKKSFTVYASTNEEKRQWMVHIRKCASECAGDGRPELSDMSPVFIPDECTSVCLHCHTSQFTVLNRRHHCRKCGIVVCGPCSTNKWVLPAQGPKPQRVCLTCFTKLNSSQNSANSVQDSSKTAKLVAHSEENSKTESTSSKDDNISATADVTENPDSRISCDLALGDNNLGLTDSPTPVPANNLQVTDEKMDGDASSSESDSDN